MDTLQAILLGIVQGITEFLPVSSSGHLQIAKELLGVELEENLTFDVALHAATVLSTIVVLWSEVWRLLKGLFSRRFNAEQAYVLKLVLSMIPIGFVGFLFKERINALLDAPYILVIVGAMLLLTASSSVSPRIGASTIRNENCATAAFLLPSKRPVAMVVPERERPGMAAQACARPMMKASR